MEELAEALSTGSEEIGGDDQWTAYLAAINAFRAASNNYGPPRASGVMTPVKNAAGVDPVGPEDPTESGEAAVPVDDAVQVDNAIPVNANDPVDPVEVEVAVDVDPAIYVGPAEAVEDDVAAEHVAVVEHLKPVEHAEPVEHVVSADTVEAVMRAHDTSGEAKIPLHTPSSRSKTATTDKLVTSHRDTSDVLSPIAASSAQPVTPGISSAAAKGTIFKKKHEAAECNETPVAESIELQSFHSTGVGSDSSDEVVFRQDELRMAGTNIPYTFRKDETLRGPRSLDRVRMKPSPAKGRTDQHPSHGEPPSCRASKGRRSRKHIPPAKEAHKQTSESNGVAIAPTTPDAAKEARKAELLAFQKKEMERYGKKVMGILSDDSPETAPLYLARQGPGVDPDSEFCNRHPLYLLTDFAKSVEAKTNEAQRKLESGESHVANGEQSSGPAVNAWGFENLANAVAVDWQYRPWEKYGDEFFSQKFRNWLDKTMRFGFIVDMTQEEFKNGEHHASLDTGMGPATFVCPEIICDTSEPENSAHCHETAIGYVHNWNLRIRQEQERKEAEERERRRLAVLPKPTPAPEEPVPYAPKLNMYIRPVEPKDIVALVEIYNWYTRNTTCRADIEEITYDEMRELIEELQGENYPFLVAAGRHPKVWHAMNREPEMLYGFCSLSDFTGPISIQRYTCEIELFVHPKRLRMGVGSCLLDKMIEICDPKYSPRGGYIFDCAVHNRDVYTMGLAHPVMRLIAIIHHSDEEAPRYAWMQRWLSKEFNFQEQGFLRGIGVNRKVLINDGYMVYNTGMAIPASE
ncbi:hypothetical protein FQN49_003451 [Arthroderma sp. PD_2]|nr:hypothetical protein FQN49_003451 [Arthroderma sp. PD_2]